MEKGGIPSVVLVTQAFAGVATIVARGMKYDGLHVHRLPHPLNPLSDEKMREITRQNLDAIVAHLLDAAPAPAGGAV